MNISKMLSLSLVLLLITFVCTGQDDKKQEDVPENKAEKIEIKGSGFTNITEFGYSPGVGYIKIGTISEKNTDHCIEIRTVNGFLAGENAFIGIGIGLDYYDDATYLPFTMDIRFKLISGRYECN